MDFFEKRRTPPAGSCVGATYSIPLSSLSDTQVKDEKAALTMQAHGTYGSVRPVAFEVWYIQGGAIHLPRFYGLERYGRPEDDRRTLGAALSDNTFEGTLSEVQERAKAVVLGKHLRSCDVGGAMICLPCGLGKTVLAVHLACALNRKTVVIVHKGVIRDQWIAAFNKFAPGLKVGVVQGGTNWEVDGVDVVIAMILTLAKRTDVDYSTFEAFGTVIVDECHHLAAKVMNRSMKWFAAFFVIGLTADKVRADGMTPLLHHSLGQEAFRAERGGTESVRVSIATYKDPNSKELLGRDGKPLMSLMLNQMAVDPRRNRFIVQRVVHMHNNGRVQLILSDRLKQLHTIHALLKAEGIDEQQIGIFCGSTKEADRAEQLSRNIVLCSYAMANEGVDKREADTCVMATPKGRVTQCVGRVQRPCPTKQTPLVLDIADDLSIFASLRWKRQKNYRREHYEVQVLSYDAPADQWFA